MNSAHSIFQRIRKCRRFCFGVGLAISLFPAVQSYGQEATTPKNESQPSAGDDASTPLKDSPPLTAREEEMLRLIKGLQERVAQLEARDALNSGEMKPAAQGDYGSSSQARLLEAAIVSLPRTDGTAGLAGANAASGVGATITSPFDKYGAQDTPKTWGAYTPNFGYKVANTEFGDMSVSIYSYVRYLNQKNLAPTYTNYFGMTSDLQQRQDVQDQ